MSASLQTTPPLARRDEDAFTWAGKVEGEEFPRQSQDSKYPLMDPPVKVPNPYGWMRDDTRTNQEILDHLKAENAYTDYVMDPLKTIRAKLYDELVGTMQETDHTTPSPKGSFLYYTRTYKGKSYAVYCRAPIITTDKEEAATWDGTAEMPVLPNEEQYLDENVLAEGKEYCSTGAVAKSPTQEYVAYTVDYTGGETYGLYIKQLKTGETKQVLSGDSEQDGCDGDLVWGKTDDLVFYSKMDETHRPFQAYKRNITTGEETLLWQEDDELFTVGLGKTHDDRFVFVEVSSSETSEYHYVDLDNPDGEMKCIAKRRKKVLYDVDHRNGYWLITTNVDETPNMRLMISPATNDCADQWKDVANTQGTKVFDGGYDRSLDGVVPFARHVVASGREGGIPRIWVLTFDDVVATSMVQLAFEEESYDVGLGPNYEYDTDKLIIAYDSMITPLQSLTLDMNDPSGPRSVLKQKNVPGYDKNLFDCKRVMVPSRDGTTQIPVSFVYRKEDMEEQKTTGKTFPTLLYGYGSYGSCMEDDFRSTRLPLLKRGMIYVMAHIRGEGEMGRQWYEEPNGAKYLCKKNTFFDFNDVAKWLIEEEKITTSDQLAIEGRSAGGLLIGNCINLAPELFKVAILGVPFVDLINTMVDASIPLTTGEWEEWGNPNEEKYFKYMSEYSPMENVKQGAKYPSCLMIGGLHDPRVQYWEPAKFAAALRYGQDSETSGPVCLKMEMSAGHFSASDRYKYLRELAFDYAFLLDQVGLIKEEEKAATET